MSVWVKYPFNYRCGMKAPITGLAQIAKSEDPAHEDGFRWRVAHIEVDGVKVLTPEKSAKIAAYLEDEERAKIVRALKDAERS